MIKDYLSIPGWMSQDELEWLAMTAKSIPPYGLIIELGVWHGRSSVALYNGAENNKIVVSIDIFGFAPLPTENGKSEGTYNLLAEYVGNTAKNGFHVKEWENEMVPGCYYIQMDSIKAANIFPKNSVDFLFEDSDHGRCGEIIDAWWPKMKNGGIISGHDYTSFDCVKNPVDMRFDVDIVGSIWIPKLTRGIGND